MTIDGVAAARALLARGTCTPGLCLSYVWQAYKAVGAATSHPAVPTALDAWLASEGQHYGDRNPPPGVPVWWGKRSWGTNAGAGDVVISLGGGRVAATDWPVNGRIGETTIAQREAQIGRPYLGWSECIFDVRVYDPAPASSGATKFTTNTTEDTDMYSIIVDGRHHYGAGKQYLTHYGDPEQADITRKVTSASDELHKLSLRQFYSLLDGLGVPREVVKDGKVLNPATGLHEANGTWSREREILAAVEAIASPRV